MGMRDWVAKVVTGGAGVAEKGSFSRFPFLAKTQESSRKRWGERRRLTVEPLEPRLLLSVTGLAVGEYTVLDNGSGTPAGVFFVDTATTGGVVTNVTTVAGSAGVAEKVTGVQIDLGSHVGVGTFKVELGMSGTTGAAPNVTFLDMNAGDKITMELDLSTVFDNVAGAGYQASEDGVFFSNTSGAGAYHVNADYTADGGTLAAATDAGGADPTYAVAGAIGTTTVPVSIGGGGGVGHLAFSNGLFTRNTNGTNIGMMTLTGGIDLTGGADLTLAQWSFMPGGTVAGITVLGNTTLENHDLLIQLDSAASLEPLSLSAAGTITLNGSGSLTVESYPTNNFAIGNLQFGALALSSSGGVDVFSDTNANIGAVTTGSITATGSASGDVDIAPSGTGDFTGLVNIGAIGIAAGSFTRVNIGNQNGGGLQSTTSPTAYLGGLTLNGLNSYGSWGSGLNVVGNGITGALNLGSNNYVLDNRGHFYLTMGTSDSGAGGVGSIDEANLILLPGARRNIDISFAGGAGAVAFGDLIDYSGYGSDINITFDSDNSGDKIASWTSQDFYIGDPAGTDNPATPSNEADPNPLGLSPTAVNNSGDSITVDVGGGVTGAVNVNDVIVRGDATDFGDLHVLFSATNNDGGFGSLTGRDVALIEPVGAVNTIIFDTDGTGGINNVTFRNLTNVTQGLSPDIIQVGHNTGANSAATLGDLSLGDVYMGATNDSVDNILFLARDIGNVSVGSQWTFNGAGSVYITASDQSAGASDATSDGQIGWVGAATPGATVWDIDFDSGVSATAGIWITADDGVGDLNIRSVDYANPAYGAIRIDANRDASGGFGTENTEDDSVANRDRVGAMGNINITTHGDNSVGDTSSGPGNAWNNVEWGQNSYVAALSIGNINIAGGAEGAFVASILPQTGDAGAGVGTDGVTISHVGGPTTDTIGTVTLAGESDGLTLVADDGIGALNINAPSSGPGSAQAVAAGIDGNTLYSIATGITIDANNDIAYEDGNGTPGANIVGSMGSIHVNGDSTAPIALSGTVTGVAVGDITLDFGNLQLSVQAGTSPTNAPSNLDRLALNDTSVSKIGNVLVSSGSIIGPLFDSNFIADSGVGSITASGDITIGVVSANHIAYNGIAGTIAHPNVNHPIGAITAGGSILIWNYRNIVTTAAAATTADLATEDAGDITAGGSIEIDHFALGGDIDNIVVDPASGTVDLQDFTVNGNVGIISSGGSAADDVTIGGLWTQAPVPVYGGGENGLIRGDPTWINAGDGTATLSLNIMNAVRSLAGTAAPPIVLVTQGDGLTTGSATDYIVALGGTWTPASTMNLTLSFDGDGITDSTDNGVTINDMTGVTSVTDSVLSIATRHNAADANNIVAYATAGLTPKTTSPSNLGPVAPLFNLGGFQDTYTSATKGRNSFYEILIEGNLTGSIGAPGNALPSATAQFVLTSTNAAILGDIGNLEIEGEWFNPVNGSLYPLPTTNPDTNTLRSAQIFVTSIGELSFGSLQQTKTPDGEYSYEAVGAASSPNNPAYTGVNATTPRDGFWHDLEDYSALAALTGEVNIPVLPSSSLVKTFVGPTGALEFIELTNNDEDSVATFDIDFNAGVISYIYLFGDDLGVEYNALSPGDPATTPSTNIYYGYPHNGNNATYPLTSSHPAIKFLEFSSSIGNINVRDINPAADPTPVNVGPISVGYYVTLNGKTDEAPLVEYINNPNQDDAHASIADMSIRFAPIIVLTDADWNAGTMTLTQTGAFAGYTFVAGDTIVLTGGTGVNPGAYTIASKVSSDAITLAVGSDVNGIGGNITDNSITGGRTVAVYGSIGNINVDGSIGSQDGYGNVFGVVSSGGVGTITTNDPDSAYTTDPDAPPAPPDSNFAGLVTDGSAGAITIAGSISNNLPVAPKDVFETPLTELVSVGPYDASGATVALVVGDPVVLALGPLGVANGNTSNWSDDVIGINDDAPPVFLGDIVAAGTIGSSATWVPTWAGTVGGTWNYTGAANATPVQAPVYAWTEPHGVFNSTLDLDGQLNNLAATYAGSQIAAPDGINVNIVAGGDIDAAIISGKRIIVDETEPQSNDSITGSIIAGATGVTFTGANSNVPVFTGATFTGGNIHGDIWSGESIGGGVNSGTVIEAFAYTDLSNNTILNNGTVLVGQYGAGVNGIDGGNISGVEGNNTVLVYASGGSAGDITSNILADADINGIQVIAGSGNTGGSLLANIEAGLDPLYDPNGWGGGGGGIIGKHNEIRADNNIGGPDFGEGASPNVVSSAGSQEWKSVKAGYEATYTDVAISGNINSDFFAGVPIGSTLPRQAAINDTQLNVAGAAFFQDADDSISIHKLWAGDTDINALTNNLYGWLAAAGSIEIHDLEIDGNAYGDNGVLGGHVAAAGLGYKEGSPDDQPNILSIHEGDIAGTLYGTFSAGMFVPVGQNPSLNSPLNSADAGPLVPGTILTTGQVDLGSYNTYDSTTDVDYLNVGVWDQTNTGTATDGLGITLPALLAGTQTGVVSGYVPAFSVGATCGIVLYVDVNGLEGAGNEPNYASGDAKRVSIVSFGDDNGNGIGIGGEVDVADGATFNMVMSNVDAVTAAGWTDENPGNPSAPSTLNPLNSGSEADNDLSIYTYGCGPNGGLNVAYDLAGFDYFNASATGNFWGSFGLGSIGTCICPVNLEAETDDPAVATAGQLSFALIGAGQDVNIELSASNNIVAYYGAASTNGSALIPNPIAGSASVPDGNIVAGADALMDAYSGNYGVVLLGMYYPGGNITGSIEAGGSIYSTSTESGGLMDIAAIGNAENENGNIGDYNDTDFMISGCSGKGSISAFIIAGDSVGGVNENGTLWGIIDAGFVDAYGSDAVGNFTGGVWAGAGMDLQMNTTADNSPDGSIADIEVAGTLNATGYGIYAQWNIGGYCEEGVSGGIQVGWNVNGGNLYGNVVAQNDITDLEVWGDLGSGASGVVTGTPGLVFAGNNIDNLEVGNPGYVECVAGHSSETDVSFGQSSFGWVYDDVYIGGSSEWAQPEILIGQGFAQGTTFLGGLDGGLRPTHDPFSINFEEFGTDLTFDNQGDTGTRMVLELVGSSTPGFSAPNVWLFNRYSVAYPTEYDQNPVGLDVYGVGATAGLGTVISLDTLDSLDAVDGSVGQIIVDNDYNIAGAVNAVAGPGTTLGSLLGGVAFATASLPPAGQKPIEQVVGMIKNPIDLGYVDVAYNLGYTTSGPNGQVQNIGLGLTGLTAYDNAAVWVSGNLGDWWNGIPGSITSAKGSIGNIVILGSLIPIYIDDYAIVPQIWAEQNIGDFYVGEDAILSYDGWSNIYFTAETGSIGVVSAQGPVTAIGGSVPWFVSGGNFDIAQNIGGLVSRDGCLYGSLTVEGSIGLLQASDKVAGTYTTETGSIGVLNTAIPGTESTASILALNATNGIYSDIDTICVTLTAKTDIGNLSAYTELEHNSLTAGGNIGNLTSQTAEIAANDLTAGGNIGNLSAFYWIDWNFLTAGGNIGNLTAQTADISDNGLTAGGNIGDLTAYSDIEGNDPTAGGSIGNITSVTSYVDDDFTAAQSIGNVTASDYVKGCYIAQTGSIGNFTSDQSYVDVTAKAQGTASSTDEDGVHVPGTGIGNVTAGTDVSGCYTVTMGTMGNITAQTGDIGTLDCPLIVVANGGVKLDPYSLQEDMYDANGNPLDGVGIVYSPLGNIYAEIVTGGSIGADASTVGGVTGQTIGGIAAPLGDVYLSLKVGGNVGGLSGQNVYTDYFYTCPLPNGTGEQFGPDVILGTIGLLRNASTYSCGSVGGVTPLNPLIIQTTDSSNNLVDYIVEVDSGTASVSYSVDGSGDVSFGSITYDAGSVASSAGIHVLTRTGERSAGGIGALGPSSMTVDVTQDLVVNGDVKTIEVDGSVYDLTVNGTLGTTAAASITTEGDLDGGTIDGNVTSITVGTVANPGSVSDLTVNGNLGSIYVLGDLYGLTVNGNAPSITVEGCYASNLTIGIPNGTGNVASNILVGSPAAGLPDAGTGDLNGLTINGNLVGGTVQVGSLENVTITGNLGSYTSPTDPFVAGDESIQVADGKLDCFTVQGINYGAPLGTDGVRGDPIVLKGGDWLSWENSLQYGATLPTPTPLDAYITVFLGCGQADLTINNGYLQEVAIAKGTASNLVVLANSSRFGSNGQVSIGAQLAVDNATLASDIHSHASPSVIAADRAAIAALNSVIRANRPILSSQLSRIAQGTSTDDIFNPGPMTANVGEIEAETNAILRLNGLAVKGDVGTIEGTIGKSSLQNLFIAGDAGCITGAAIINKVYVGGDLGTLDGTTVINVHVLGDLDTLDGTTVSNVNVGDDLGTLNGTTVSNVYVGGDLDTLSARTINNVHVVGDVYTAISASAQASNLYVGGNAGLVDGGVNLINVTINGCVDAVKATNNVSKVHVGGNAGIVSSGNLLSQISVGGSSLSVGARVMSNVQITGSVGFGIDCDENVVLGNAFSLAQAASDLGLSESGLADAGSKGPKGVRYLGGLETAIAGNVSVGGSISELLISQMSTQSDSLLNSTVDNAIMYTRKGLFEKQDGVLTVYPGQPQPSKATIQAIIQALEDLFKHWRH